ncbi:MAG: hypothetical protein KAT76_03690 [Bacteroidales bacterium]|nr:hypothetical protein [Bacteroidales bacterium]
MGSLWDPDFIDYPDTHKDIDAAGITCLFMIWDSSGIRILLITLKHAKTLMPEASHVYSKTDGPETPDPTGVE